MITALHGLLTVPRNSPGTKCRTSPVQSPYGEKEVNDGLIKPPVGAWRCLADDFNVGGGAGARVLWVLLIVTYTFTHSLHIIY